MDGDVPDMHHHSAVAAMSDVGRNTISLSISYTPFSTTRALQTAPDGEGREHVTDGLTIIANAVFKVLNTSLSETRHRAATMYASSGSAGAGGSSTPLGERSANRRAGAGPA